MFQLVDLPHVGGVTPLIVPGLCQWLLTSMRPETEVLGLARAEVYGQVVRLSAEARFFSREELVGLGDADALLARTWAGAA